MGLDMYLNARKYISEYEDDAAVGVETAAKYPELNGARVKYITAELAYWRKANAIHNWFVQNVQNGVDDCGEYYVTRENIETLLGLVNSVLDGANPKDILPTIGGFFFGSTEYNEWYYEDLKSTKEQLEKILFDEKLFKRWDIYYNSSW